MTEDTKEWNGHRIRFRPALWEEPVLRNTLFEDSYKLRSCGVVPGHPILDIGGHIGSFAILAAYLWPDNEIRCYEMVPDHFEILKSNTAGFQNVRVYNGAVIGEHQPEGFVVHPTNSGGSHVVWTPGGENFTAVFKVSDIVTEQVGLLKMDCEGMEHDIVDSLIASGKISLIEKMALEYHNFWGRDGTVLRESLQNAGFQTQMMVYNPQCGLLWAYRKSWEL